ncbi:hypothetical protein EDD17DRAFT_55107 [Pisolithus thermaeus]|nr:hypothetical protein EV401DRAFT_792210 [Pisolithus croceorrhizus]KAI6166369.1 hypothetical protein EDD17DRAFT_55107 [Pisolithus thermaeus]
MHGMVTFMLEWRHSPIPPHPRFRSFGRFLEAIELETMLPHILMSYDVKFEDSVCRPTDIHWDLNVIADPTSRVTLRKRIDS